MSMSDESQQISNVKIHQILSKHVSTLARKFKQLKYKDVTAIGIWSIGIWRLIALSRTKSLHHCRHLDMEAPNG
jgi:hypothetical protein